MKSLVLLIVCISMLANGQEQTSQEIKVDSGLGQGTLLCKSSVGDIYIESIPTTQQAHLAKAGALQAKMDQKSEQLRITRKDAREAEAKARHVEYGAPVYYTWKTKAERLKAETENLSEDIENIQSELQELKKIPEMHKMMAANTGRTYAGKPVWRYAGKVKPPEKTTKKNRN